MIYVEHRYSYIRLDVGVFSQIDKLLRNNGYVGAIASMVESLNSVFEISKKETLDRSALYDPYEFEEFEVGAEIYSKESSIIILTYRQEAYGDPDSFYFPEGVHITVISRNRELAEKLIIKTGESILEFLENNDEITKYQEREDVIWKETIGDRIPEFLKSDYSEPEYSKEDFEISQYLVDKNAREILKLVATTGSISADDVYSDISKKLSIDNNTIDSVISDLLLYNLLDKKAILICKKSNKALTILGSEKELENDVVSNLQCATCGRKYSSELIRNIYSLSIKARSLTKKSKWLDILVTAKLESFGIPKNRIFWNVQDRSEEVDIVLDYKGEVVLIELKDKDFETGNAYPLNYRRVKYEASKIMIVTTGVVSEEAKSVFMDVHNKVYEEEVKEYESSIIPEYIEGLQSLNGGIKKLINSIELIHIDRVLVEVEDITGISFDPIIESYKNESLPNKATTPTVTPPD